MFKAGSTVDRSDIQALTLRSACNFAPISQLSQELIDEIIDHLQVVRLQNDGWADRDLPLRTCALISRLFRPRAQQHLFTHIGIKITSSHLANPFFERLNVVFSTNPKLASHVRIFTLRIRDTGDLWSRGQSYPSRCGLQIHLTNKDPNAHHSQAMLTFWSHLSLNSDARFIPSVVTSRLTSIEIRNLHDVPIVLFDTCSNLRKLDVFTIRLAPFEESARIPVEKRPLIRELWVANSEDLICYTGLRFDALGGWNRTMDKLDIIQHIFTGADSNLSSLEYLNLFLGTYDIDTHLYQKLGVDFARMPNLCELEFKANCMEVTFVSDKAEPKTDMITILSEFLATFPAEHKLKLMHILFDLFMVLDDEEDIPGDHRSRPIEAHMRTGNWAAFDEAIVTIASSGNHPLELRIELEYYINWGENATRAAVEAARLKDQGELEDWGVKYLPRASSSSNVVLEVSTRYDDSHGAQWPDCRKGEI
ncbi:hypothetical protein M413DRAFT_443682 [Hebeloma cylindrosporum]|uniref:F-box domain-containing protein n=1 Tax=Hebeloma cylindrosporum TaxID=76867 RepID=A0A0C3CI15_HEBCY|nr:hypothetical protein M413DRAFT_443682 [Hebeloma cylindrosporum h7]